MENKNDSLRQAYDYAKPDLAYEPGFNSKTVVAALFIGLIMLPAAIYLGLITGFSLAGAAQWVTLILFVEVTKRSFIQLRPQEIYIIFIVAASLVAPGVIMGTADLALQGGAFSSAIWQQYFAGSPYARAFNITPEIPHWIVPPAGSEALLQRNLLHRAWFLPVLIIIIHEVLFRINYFTLGYTVFRITSDREKLPFPMAPVMSEGVFALADSSAKKNTDRWRIFTIGAMIGIIYGAFYVFIPTFSGLVMARPFMLIPIPFVDFTTQIGARFPGAIIGLMTDLANLMVGFVLPFWVVVGTFIGSFGAGAIANPLLHRYTGFLSTWQPGMSAVPAQVSNTIDFWVSVTIGVGIVVFLLGVGAFIFNRRKSSSRIALEPEKLPEGRGDYPVPVALTIWALCTVLYVILCTRLLWEPGGSVYPFPFYFFVFFGFVMTPILTYISARLFGIVGVARQVSFPYLREGTYILSGVQGAPIWFAPVPYFNHGQRAQQFRQMELTGTRFTSWYKAEFTALAIMLICSFFFWAIIWRMAPIPSSTYPFVQRMWPLYATQKALWISSTVEGGATFLLDAIRPSVIGWSVAGGLGFVGLLGLLGLPLTIFYGMVAGITMLPHMALPMFIGALLGRFVFRRVFGEERWRRITPLLLAGYGCGIGLIGAASVAVALIARTVFQLVF